MDAFSSYHPIVNFSYFTMVILFSMFFMHPVCLMISLVAAFSYSVYMKGNKALSFNLKYMIPMMLVTALINPAFNHEGVTIITYLSNGNPLTLESIIYGVAAAMMLVTVICWFSCYNAVMTSDKFIYLFGRIIPSLSLIFSMVLRFVPRFKKQFIVVSNAQKCVGRDVTNGGFIQRIKHGVKIMSVMISWSLENAIETADSMKSRGYGLKGRTAFSIFTFDERDRKALTIIVILFSYIMVGAFKGGMYFRYFPSMKTVQPSIYSMSVFFAYFVLCMTPIGINIMEDRKWKQLKSRI